MWEAFSEPSVKEDKLSDSLIAEPFPPDFDDKLDREIARLKGTL